MKALDVITYGNTVLGMRPLHSAFMLANVAGRELVNARPWNFLHRTATLGIVSGQDFISLPADYGGFVALEGKETFLQGLFPTTPDSLLRRRQANTVFQNHPFSFVASYRAPVSGKGPPTRVLELSATPSTTDANYGTLWYVAQWVEITAEQDDVSIPPELEPCYLAFVEAVWFGVTEQEKERGTFGERIAAVMQSPTYVNAVRWDERLQTKHGRIQGGAARQEYEVPLSAATNFQISDP